MVQYSASSHWFWHYELQHHWYQLTPGLHQMQLILFQAIHCVMVMNSILWPLQYFVATAVYVLGESSSLFHLWSQQLATGLTTSCLAEEGSMIA